MIDTLNRISEMKIWIKIWFSVKSVFRIFLRFKEFPKIKSFKKSKNVEQMQGIHSNGNKAHCKWCFKKLWEDLGFHKNIILISNYKQPDNWI